MSQYDYQKIEKKWQKRWEKSGIYKAEDFSKKKKYYCLIEFPYPSGEGLHVGHTRSYTAMDVIARKRRMEGYNVLNPIGWDAFGLPTENFAIKTGIHPKIVTKKNTDNFRRQLKLLGFSFDWDREINTTDPQYYKWTQWIFIQLYKKGLAYKKKLPINWCLSCKVGLANEEVVNGRCERCGGATEKKEKDQWILAITKYADRLADDLDKVDYLEKIKIQQKNWIGRSAGALIKFPISNPLTGGQFSIDVFTTRIDTIFGCTYVVVAPEHEVIRQLADQISNLKEVERYLDQAKKKSELQRTELEKEKTGVELKGVKAINPANKKEVPVFAADYILGHYGTGAVMAVPAHDERDAQFAEKFNLPVSDAPLVEPEKAMIAAGAKKTTQYHLRDWIFSRQHYWGEPIPMVYCEKCGWVPVPEKDLPVKLPDVKKYEPVDTGESPLANIKNWVETKCSECKGPAKRETDTMPNWAGSSWYFLRYIDPKNKKSLADKKKLKYWMPVDWYNGGMEHTTLHLLYSRFWNKFLFDIGAVPASEPYKKRTSHGMILGEDGEKMSKSRGNIVNPDLIVSNFGADAYRLYQMFMGPFDQAIPWDSHGIEGTSRFLQKIWKLAHKVKPCAFRKGLTFVPLENLLHQTIKKVTEDIEDLKFNTAISQLMILINELEKKPLLKIENWKLIIKLLAPFAPHIAEELWSQQGNKESIFKEKWPKYDPKKIQEKAFNLVVQINGKVRDTFEAAAGISENDAKQLTLKRENVKKWIGAKPVKKVIFVPNKLINIVV